MDTNNAIEIRNISKSFKTANFTKKTRHEKTLRKEENIVLDGISTRIRKGEVVGIIGRNGSGKSTLLKMVSRIMIPDKGMIEINGTVASILELGMGFHPEMTGRENIYIKGSMYGFSKSQIEDRIDKIIEYSTLGDYIDAPLKTYSSGMGGKLAFAIMIHVDADIFLIDEIFSIGDLSFSAKAALHFKNIAKSGKTVLLVSHSLGTIEEMCSRAIWIEEGRIKEDGPARRVCEHYQREMMESFEITSELAESGVADAQYRLAHMYTDGTKIGKDSASAYKWMGRAAENRHTLAQVEYADMLFVGTDAEQNITAAIFYYQEAANAGNNDARMKISTLMSNEKNDDKEEILNLFRRFAEPGNPHNEFKYADLLMKTAWNDNDRKEALDWFLRSADKGHLESKVRAATIYRDGVGVKIDLDRSIKMFEEAASAGHIQAQVTLADMFFTGIKVEKDVVRAFEWYLRSAESGNFRSQYQVATMYRDGLGIAVNYEESKKWFEIFSQSFLTDHQIAMSTMIKNWEEDTKSEIELLNKAVKSYNPNAMFQLGVSHRDRNPPDVDTAIKWLTKSAEKNHLWSQIALGDMFLRGVGSIEKDFQKAFHYYMLAFLNGYTYISYQISIMYKEGLGVDQSVEKYREFLRIAVECGNKQAISEFKNIDNNEKPNA